MTESEIAVIIERLDNLRKDQGEQKAAFIASQVKADTWREKFDEKLNHLPCPENTAKLSGLKTQLAWIWGMMTVILAAIIADWVKK